MLFNLSLDEEVKIVEAILKEKQTFQNLKVLYSFSPGGNSLFNIGLFYFSHIMVMKNIRGTNNIIQYLEKIISDYREMDRNQFILTYGKSPFYLIHFFNVALAAGTFSESELKEFIDKIIK